VPSERAFSKLGLASRAEARALIQAGRVEIDGRRASDPRVSVVPERVQISIDGRRVDRTAWRLVLLHKPRGVVTTKRDPEGRRTVYATLRAAGDRDWLDRLVPVGRLDLASTGLLLLTSDTRLADWLTDPRNAIVRRYVVTIRGELHTDAQASLPPAFAELRRGKSAAALEILKRSKRETHLIVELTEGKNREIRRMFEAIGHEVTRLKTDWVRRPRARGPSAGRVAGGVSGGMPRSISGGEGAERRGGRGEKSGTRRRRDAEARLRVSTSRLFLSALRILRDL